MINENTQWHKTMLKKYGSNEAIEIEMKKRASKGGKNPNSRNGFNKDHKRAAEAGKKGRAVRYNRDV